jgi:hypothetical protein
VKFIRERCGTPSDCVARWHSLEALRRDTHCGGRGGKKSYSKEVGRRSVDRDLWRGVFVFVFVFIFVFVLKYSTCSAALHTNTKRPGDNGQDFSISVSRTLIAKRLDPRYY